MRLVGERERERALSLLRSNYADGRLDLADLSQRAGVAAGARTTEDIRVALTGLPSAWLESELAPRLLALRATRAGATLVYWGRRLALAVVLAALWLAATLVLLAGLFVAELLAGSSTVIVVSFLVAWLVVTWLVWRSWQRGPR